MKKILVIIMALCLAMPYAAAADQTAKQLEKAMNKQKKEKLKEFKKENWKIFGSTNTLEVALLKHYDKLKKLGDEGHEVVGLASSVKSKNIAKQTAYNNACISYAQEAGSDLKGRVVSDIYGAAGEPDSEFDHFYAAYERSLEKEIRGELKESFTVIREKKDGSFEMQTFFIVDEDGAAQARMNALKNAMAESEIAKAHAEKISEFVRGKK